MVTCALPGHCLVETPRRAFRAKAVQVDGINKQTIAIDTPSIDEALVDVDVVRVHDASLFARLQSFTEALRERRNRRVGRCVSAALGLHPAPGLITDGAGWDSGCGRVLQGFVARSRAVWLVEQLDLVGMGNDAGDPLGDELMRADTCCAGHRTRSSTDGAAELVRAPGDGH